MTNNKQQRADIIDNTIDRYDSDLMYHIQQYVIDEFMDEACDDLFYIQTENDVQHTFNTNIYLGQQVVDEYVKNNKLSIKDVNGVLYEYKELVCEMDLDTEDNIGSMVNCIMFNIADKFSNALDFK